MKKSKFLLGLVLCVALLLSVALPHSLPTYADMDDVTTECDTPSETVVEEGVSDGEFVPVEEETEEPTLYEKIMATTTLSELEQLADECTDEAVAAMSAEEQENVKRHIMTLLESEGYEPIESAQPEKGQENSDERDITYVTVDVVNVAPLMPPVVGDSK